MAIKIFSHYNRPLWQGQVFKDPSLTDQLADEPLQRIFQRYVATGNGLPMLNGDVDSMAPEQELDSALADAFNDVSCMTRVEQMDVLATAQRLVEQLQKSSVKHAEKPKKALNASATEPTPSGVATSSKDAVIVENAQENE